MPISILNLNESPYNDDYDISKQYHRVLFKPRFAVQARELTQLQTILQNQIEQFGDNIFQEGSIIKGCNFTELRDLEYVKVQDRAGFDVSQYVGEVDEETGIDTSYELVGQVTGLRASIIGASRGFETNDPDLNTFYIKYLNKNSAQDKTFQSGELLNINRIRVLGDTTLPPESGDVPATTINATTRANHIGKSFGLRISEGIIFQKGHFLFAAEQMVIVSKYTNQPDGVSVGYRVEEHIVTARQDASLYDNAMGSPNENAPGADRLKLVPTLVTIPTPQAEADTTFYILARYVSGSAVQVRDVSQYNVLGKELAKRTYEESGDYILQDFKVQAVRSPSGTLQASISPGVAYVKGFRVENRSELYIDIEPIEETAVQANQPISFDYGGYVPLTSVAGRVSATPYTRVNLRDTGNDTIGTAILRAITADRAYLADIRMSGSNVFASVRNIQGSTSGQLNIAADSTIRETTNSVSVFDTGMFSLFDTENITIPVRATQALTGMSGTTLVLNADPNEDFNFVSHDDIVLVDSTNTVIPVTDAVVSSGGSVLTLTLGTSPAATGTIQFNKRLVDVEPYPKLARTVYVRSTFSTTSAKYNLGFPDVFEIVSIEDANGVDVTSSFRLQSNQKDHYYDHSYIEYIAGRTVPAAGDLLIQLRVFELNTSSGYYFFTINSYPNDLTSDKIPAFTSSSGRTYNLRDCFDFRPYVNRHPNASFAAVNPGDALVVSDATTGVNNQPTISGSILVPALKNAGQVDVEYYLNRVDLVTLDSYGQFAVIRGDEKQRATPPNVPTGTLVISEIFVPGYPALTPLEAASIHKPQYGVKTKARGVKNYTMKDIQSIEQSVEKLRYYVLLSALEASTQNMNIQDENGLTRFKNGIIVDPFDDLSIANIEDPEYSAAVDFTEKSLMPAVRSFPLKLKQSVASGVDIHPNWNTPEAITLSNGEPVPVISQRYATGFRSCSSNFYSYSGQGFIYPEFDAAYDMTTNPIQVDLDFGSSLEQFAENLQEIYPLTSTSIEVLSSSSTTKNERRVGRVTTTNELIKETVKELQISKGNAEVQEVGEFVTNFEFSPFMRSKELSIMMTGLRPDTRHYFFFDREDVNEFVAPGSNEAEVKQIQRAGAFGDPIISDGNGMLRAVFKIPEGKFPVGERMINIYDVDTFINISAAGTSGGTISYNAYNFSVDKTNLTLATRKPESTVKVTTTTNNVTTRTVAPPIALPEWRGGPGVDGAGPGETGGPGGVNGGVW